MRQILGAVSQYERALIRGRMLSGKAAKWAVGGYVGGKPPPCGFKAQGGELVPDEPESELVVLILRLCREGASCRAVNTHLTEAGSRLDAGRASTQPKCGPSLSGVRNDAPASRPRCRDSRSCQSPAQHAKMMSAIV
jgi:hypothetical protein